MSATFNLNTVLKLLSSQGGGCKLNDLIVDYMCGLKEDMDKFSIDDFVDWLRFQDGIAVVTYTHYMAPGTSNNPGATREKMFVCTK